MMCDLDAQKDLVKKLGKVKTWRSCIYIKKVEDIDIEVLKQLIRVTMEETKKLYG